MSNETETSQTGKPLDFTERIAELEELLAKWKTDASEPAVGTGAWAWQQMQRGADVWVCLEERPVASAYHMKHPGLIEGKYGAQFNGTDPMVLEKMWPGFTSWQLCPAPSAKPAEPSGNAELTAEEVGRIWDEVMPGGDWARFGHFLDRNRGNLLRFANACRRGMVPQSTADLESAKLYAACTKAEARVRELEAQAAEDAKVVKRLRDSYCTVCIRVDAWQTMARDIGAEQVGLPGDPLTDAVRQLVEGLRTQLTAANATIEGLRGGVGDEVTEGERIELLSKADKFAVESGSTGFGVSIAFTRELIRLARVNHRPKLREVTDEETLGAMRDNTTGQLIERKKEEPGYMAMRIALNPYKFRDAILKLATEGGK